MSKISASARWIYVNCTRQDHALEFGTGGEMRFSPFEAISQRRDTPIAAATSSRLRCSGSRSGASSLGPPRGLPVLRPSAAPAARSAEPLGAGEGD